GRGLFEARLDRRPALRRTPVELDETAMRLHRHLRERAVVEHPRQAVTERLVRTEGRPFGGTARREGARQRREVALDGVLAVDQRLAAADRTPEVVDVVRVRPGLLAEDERARLRADQHRDRAGT